MAKATSTPSAVSTPAVGSIAAELLALEEEQRAITEKRNALLGSVDDELQVIFVLHAAAQMKNHALAALTGKGRVHGLKKAGETVAKRGDVEAIAADLIAYATERVKALPKSE